MIGTDLNLSLPTLADTYSIAIGKVATALQSIEDSIADRATPTGLNLTANLSLVGNHLTNVGGLILASGNIPVVAGSVYYNGTNFYVRDATGIIQLTAAGAINVAGVGGISGDYGGSNPATASYDEASGEFRFKEESTLYADVRVDDVILMEPGASPVDSVRLTAQAMTTSYTVTFPAAVPAVQSLVQMSPAGAITTGGATVDHDITLAANRNFTVSGSGKYKHGTKELYFPVLASLAKTTAGVISQPTDKPVANVPISCVGYLPLTGVPIDALLRTLTVNTTNNIGTGTTFSLAYFDYATNAWVNATAETVSGSISKITTLTLVTPIAMSGVGTLWVKVTTNAGSTADLALFSVTYTVE